jgi:hypothetical protein
MKDQIDTLGHARKAGLKVCCGSIVGLGETVGDRLGMLMLLNRILNQGMRAWAVSQKGWRLSNRSRPTKS